MILIGLAIETIGTLGVVSGVADRAAALVIAGYCAVTAILYKRFWAQGDFWANSDGKGRGLVWDFLKNLSLGAGFLLIVVSTWIAIAAVSRRTFCVEPPLWSSSMSNQANDIARDKAGPKPSVPYWHL